MHKPSLPQLVYNALFTKPRGNDPSSFSSHITRNLVPEVRVETSTFYGTLDCIEAQYPGLDYSYAPHRMRLSRFHHHRRLFRVFDELSLTEAEIASLCRWEGTKSARERYERDTEVRVRDTTADDIRIATPPLPPSVHVYNLAEREASSSIPRLVSSTLHFHNTSADTISLAQQAPAADESSSDEDLESYGVALNEHLLEATAAREQGMNVTLDEIWEQWLKEAIERGGYTDMLDAIREGRAIDFNQRGPPQHIGPPVSGRSISASNNTNNNAIHHPPSSRLPPMPISANDLLSTLGSIPLSTAALAPTSTSSNRTSRRDLQPT